jgi:broad specificity phosphatase PhoE
MGIAPLMLYVARHAETNDNKDRILTGQNDPKLNGTGFMQAASMARLLESVEFVAAYSSDLSRAKMTAQIIALPHEIEVVPDGRLREVDIGKLAGLQRSEAYARFPGETLRTMHPDFDFGPVGGENRAQVIRRELSFFIEICTRHSATGGNILVVGHGSALRLILPHLGAPDGKLHEQGGYIRFKPFGHLYSGLREVSAD